MAGLTLDAGALIAFERGRKDVGALIEEARRRRAVITIPAPALAQVWRGASHARLAMLCNSAIVEPFDENAARRAGELCGRAGTSDIVDAAVVWSAAQRGDAVITSDSGDIQRLAPFVHNLGPVISI